MTRLTCKRNFSKEHRLVAPKGYDPLARLEFFLPNITLAVARRYRYAYKVPEWFRRHLPKTDGSPGDMLDFVNGRDAVEEMRRRAYVESYKEMVISRHAVNSAWLKFRESMYRYEHVVTVLGRRRMQRRGLVTVEDIENVTLSGNLRERLETDVRTWLQLIVTLRTHQYMYYLLVQARAVVGPHLMDTPVDMVEDY
jgi:hypothetical protein